MRALRKAGIFYLRGPPCFEVVRARVAISFQLKNSGNPAIFPDTLARFITAIDVYLGSWNRF